MSTVRSSSPALGSAAASAVVSNAIASVLESARTGAANVVPSASAASSQANDDDDALAIDENLDDIAAGDDDGKDVQDPYAFIDRSLRYADLLLCKKQAEERVQHVIEFEKGMPIAKRPSNGKNGGCITAFQAKVDKAQERLDNFRTDYAAKRVAAKIKRTERLAREKLAKSHQGSIGKPMLDSFGKRFKIAKILAAKAAAEALRSCSADATKEEKKVAAEKAFDEAAAEAMKSGAKLPDIAELAKMAEVANAEMDGADLLADEDDTAPDAGSGAAVSVA